MPDLFRSFLLFWEGNVKFCLYLCVPALQGVKKSCRLLAHLLSVPVAVKMAGSSLVCTDAGEIHANAS